MDRGLFLRAKNFICSDIQREITLAKLSEEQLPNELRRVPGGGNLLAALGLLCYTEFAGGLKRGNCSQRQNRANFTAFFDELGPKYKELNEKRNVYTDLRCGLVHEYYVKERCEIAMLSKGEDVGVWWNGDKYFFVVERYFEDFRRAFLELERRLYPNKV